MNLQNTVSLRNGVEIPQFGLGVFRIRDGLHVQDAVLHAIQLGYRSFDTASLYGNEIGVGKAIRSSGVPREEIFITTKVWNTQQGYDQTIQAFEESRERLGVEYIDLYLVHWPIQKTMHETWKAMEFLYSEKRVRAIGVSNFYESHLEMLLSRCTIAPMVNQVELHPLLQLAGLRDYCAQKGIAIEAWAPIMRGKVKRLLLLKNIAQRYGKTAVQVALRWAIQHGVIVIPKSENPLRIASNADVFDFVLTAEEMSSIDVLDRGKRLGPHPDNFFH